MCISLLKIPSFYVTIVTWHIELVSYIYINMKVPCIYIILLLSLNHILLLCELKAITCTISCRFCWDQFWWGYTSSLWHIQSHAHGWHWCKFPPCLYAIEDLSNTYVHIFNRFCPCAFDNEKSEKLNDESLAIFVYISYTFSLCPVSVCEYACNYIATYIYE